MRYMKRFINRKTVNSLFAIIGLIIIVYIFIRLKDYIGAIDIDDIAFKWHFLILSFAIVPVWFTIRSFIWKFILREMDEHISLIDSMRLIGLSNFGKYIPGKVWFTVGRTVLAERLGISKRKSFTSIIIDTYFLVFTSSIFLLILIFKINMQGYNYIPYAVGFIVIMIPFIIPSVTKRIMNLIFRLLKKENIQYNMRLSSVMFILLSDCLIWALQGLQFYLLIRSITDFHFSPFISFLIYPAAWAMGFIVLFMPAGLGIREGLITFALLQIFPPEMKGMAVIAAVVSRIQFTLSELSYLITLIGSKKIWRSDEKRKN